MSLDNLVRTGQLKPHEPNADETQRLLAAAERNPRFLRGHVDRVRRVGEGVGQFRRREDGEKHQGLRVGIVGGVDHARRDVGDIAGALDDSGLPDVFVGLEPLPLSPVDPPTRQETERIAIIAEKSTAHITTKACDKEINGSGVIVAKGYVVTNAHVVAGSTAIEVRIGRDVANGTVVMFDPDLDVALVYAPTLDGPPLHFAAKDPARGTMGAALGYAGGGPLVVLPAAITGSYPATGRDIYGVRRITREILELRAAVEPGDSGGPLVLSDGTIGGLVFAESRTDPAIGYALTPTVVAARLASALGRIRATGVGECLR